MSQEIIQEVTFFLHSVLMGLLITFVYDWIRVLRKLARHGSFLTSVEDFLFWLACGIAVFYMLYKENNGVLRWFAVVGAALGMLFYKAIIRDWFVYVMSTCIYKIMWFVFGIIQIVLKPLKWLFLKEKRFVQSVAKKMKKCQEFVKKRLTVCIKTLKIVLCKR